MADVTTRARWRAGLRFPRNGPPVRTIGVLDGVAGLIRLVIGLALLLIGVFVSLGALAGNGPAFLVAGVAIGAVAVLVIRDTRAHGGFEGPCPVCGGLTEVHAPKTHEAVGFDCRICRSRLILRMNHFVLFQQPGSAPVSLAPPSPPVATVTFAPPRAGGCPRDALTGAAMALAILLPAAGALVFWFDPRGGLFAVAPATVPQPAPARPRADTPWFSGVAHARRAASLCAGLAVDEAAIEVARVNERIDLARPFDAAAASVARDTAAARFVKPDCARLDILDPVFAGFLSRPARPQPRAGNVPR